MPNQYFAALTNMRSVGVMGDERTYDYAVALRAVNTIDFMTAESAQIPFLHDCVALHEQQPEYLPASGAAAAKP